MHSSKKEIEFASRVAPALGLSVPDDVDDGRSSIIHDYFPAMQAEGHHRQPPTRPPRLARCRSR